MTFLYFSKSIWTHKKNIWNIISECLTIFIANTLFDISKLKLREYFFGEKSMLFDFSFPLRIQKAIAKCQTTSCKGEDPFLEQRVLVCYNRVKSPSLWWRPHYIACYNRRRQSYPDRLRARGSLAPLLFRCGVQRDTWLLKVTQEICGIPGATLHCFKHKIILGLYGV